MKKWDVPMLKSLSVLNTSNICDIRGLSGWFICTNGHCFELDDHNGQVKCPTCKTDIVSSYCPPCS